MAASLLTDAPLRLLNMPRLADTRILGRLLMRLGAEVEEHDGADGQGMTLHTREIVSAIAPYALVREMRASFNVLGPLLARSRQAKVSLPGGDPIGARPLDFHLNALAELGATIDLVGGYVFAQAPRGLKGGHVAFPSVSVGATEHTMLAAVLARGETLIENAACEPEIVDLADCLNAMGARIEGAGTGRIQIQGVTQLHAAEHRVLPDRIEAGTYAVAAAMAGGDVTLTGARPAHLLPLLDALRTAGAQVDAQGETIRVRREPGTPLRATDIETQPFPGFATDLQAQFMALMTLAEGESVIRETIFENRFIHAAELAADGGRDRGAGG